MRTEALIGIALLFAANSAQAADDDCKVMDTQAQMNMCSARDFAAADARLNSTYRKVMNSTDGARRNQLKISERAWLAYRDAQCDFEKMAVEGGTAEPTVHALCLESVTTARIKELKNGVRN